MKLHSSVESMRKQIRGLETKPGEKHGIFFVPFENNELKVIISAGNQTGWEHVSVSLKNRCPNWREMCHVKDLFWSEEEVVVQFHPKKSEYVNNHPTCLHLFKHTSLDFPTPPSILIGIKGLEDML